MVPLPQPMAGCVQAPIPDVDVTHAPLAPPLPALVGPSSIPAVDVLDARPHPRIVSHLRPIYTEQLALEYELREKKRMEDEARLTSAKRAKERVIVYAWSLPDEPPLVHAVQGGFSWPYFDLSLQLLTRVGLDHALGRQALQMYDDEGLDMWIDVDVGYIVAVKEGQAIYLRDRVVAHPIDFQFSRTAHAQASTPNIRNLPAERHAVREAYKLLVPSSSTPSSSISFATPNRKRKLSDSSIISISDSFPTPRHASPMPIIISDMVVPSIPLSPVPTAATASSGIVAASVDPIRDTTPVIKSWPADFYVCEIVNCFRDCKTSIRRNGRNTRTAEVKFNEHFPCNRYVPSTYSDQKKLWQNAPDVLKDQFYQAGKVKGALWFRFAEAARKARKD